VLGDLTEHYALKVGLRVLNLQTHHQKHFEIFDHFYFVVGVCIICCCLWQLKILTHGSGTFIAERFLFESVKEDCDDLKIVIPSELEDSYFNRMVEEIENNRFYNVFIYNHTCLILVCPLTYLDDFCPCLVYYTFLWFFFHLV
jgi:hypothetical protein